MHLEPSRNLKQTSIPKGLVLVEYRFGSTPLGYVRESVGINHALRRRNKKKMKKRGEQERFAVSINLLS
jgi:hypothetical protein